MACTKLLLVLVALMALTSISLSASISGPNGEIQLNNEQAHQPDAELGEYLVDLATDLKNSQRGKAIDHHSQRSKVNHVPVSPAPTPAPKPHPTPKPQPAPEPQSASVGQNSVSEGNGCGNGRHNSGANNGNGNIGDCNGNNNGGNNNGNFNHGSNNGNNNGQNNMNFNNGGNNHQEPNSNHNNNQNSNNNNNNNNNGNNHNNNNDNSINDNNHNSGMNLPPVRPIEPEVETVFEEPISESPATEEKNFEPQTRGSSNGNGENNTGNNNGQGNSGVNNGNNNGGSNNGNFNQGSNNGNNNGNSFMPTDANNDGGHKMAEQSQHVQIKQCSPNDGVNNHLKITVVLDNVCKSYDTRHNSEAHTARIDNLNLKPCPEGQLFDRVFCRCRYARHVKFLDTCTSE